MSAVAGLIYLDGRPVEQGTVGGMVEAMTHRGPDRQLVWTEGSAGLGHGMLETTPESLHEHLPWQHEASQCVITADARIDNRDELCSALGLRQDADRVIPDSHLILRAYLKWGDDCVDHLLGALAFAIWDPREQKLFCARDHMGIRPFYYYHQPGQLLAFASEIKALLTLEEVPRRLNEVRIADYLATMYEDKEITEYEEIRRLPPGHVLTIDTSGLQMRKYWELELGPTIQMESDEAYAERFRELMTEAVRCRMRSKKPVATELSGGLDSSFVACLARDAADGPVYTISSVYPDIPASNESEYISAILDTDDKFIPSWINGERGGFLANLNEVFHYIDEGIFLSGAHHIMWANYKAISKAESRVLLTGVDGDSVVDHGTLYLSELAGKGQWDRFAEEVKHLAQSNTGIGDTQEFLAELASEQKIIDRYGRPSLRQAILDLRYIHFFKAVQSLSKQLPVTMHKLLRSFAGDFARSIIGGTAYGRIRGHASLTGDGGSQVQIESLDASFAKEIDYYARHQKIKTNKSSAVRKRQCQLLNSGVFTTTLEACNHYTSAHSIEAAHPFMDIRLLEFAVRLPPEQSLSDGTTRAVMRRAMKGIVPDKVRLRRAKADLHPAVMKQINLYDQEILLHLSQDLGPLHKYANFEQYRELFEERRRLNPKGEWRFTFLTNLALWLKYRQERLQRSKSDNPKDVHST